MKSKGKREDKRVKQREKKGYEKINIRDMEHEQERRETKVKRKSMKKHTRKKGKDRLAKTKEHERMESER